ncbi:hypothetical protein OUZ56_013674 [Daphnia magna]|uniref:Uncharacterized protein n=1 Tax=Daphnia magna TaxID=35525 RepID=A0ABQ9Z6M3_9CRUS|nr:hypothetical protein OUZ56_013674 [Daphnia magna]
MALAEFVLELNETGFPRLFGFTTSEIRVEADNFTPFDSNKNNSVIIAEIRRNKADWELVRILCQPN